ncbi:MAG: CDP-diacylglycerol--serine O-phosphatidyltransferase [Bacteroidales bacterium]|jgi:CDP-diacylglycerol--serine O-phosphatidyltransferase|nr:CDP-diacylglycerol--serine O-phosphatidyltransferase [Bacteroidales bacterium]
MFEKISSFRHIPNAITCLNLFCGCLSVISAFNNRLETASYFIFAAAVFDFFDGFTARWLKAYSAIGKELDSLADMVSFGIAPASIMYALLLTAASKHGLPVETCAFGWLVAAPAFMLAVFSALRLAKFNTDTRQTDSFIGVPTPAAALFICSLAFISSESNSLAMLTGNMFFLLAVVAVFSYLLVAELPLFSLKFKSFDWKSNKTRYVFMALSAFILLILHWAGLALVISVYIVVSIFTNIFCDRKGST